MSSKISIFKNLKNGFSLLKLKDKVLFLKICAITIFGSLLESFGIGLFIPLINSLSQSGMDHWFINFIFSLLNNFNLDSNIHTLVILIVSFFIIKNSYLTFQAWYQVKFVNDTRFNITQKLFYKLFNVDYIDFSKKKQSDVIRDISIDTDLLAVNFLEPIVILFTEISVIFFICSILILFDPYGTLIILIFVSICIFFFHILTKKFTNDLGEKRQIEDGKKIDSLKNFLNGFKEIYIFNLFSKIYKDFTDSNASSTEVRKKQLFMVTAPKYWLECIFIISFSIFLIIKFNTSENGNVLVTLGLFAAAVFRIFPSINRILSSLQRLNFSNTIVSNLNKNLKYSRGNQKNNNQKIFFNKKIKFINISFGYEYNKIINNFNFEITKGDFVGLIGKTGSGKTTLLNLFIGLLKPHEGKILIDETDITNSSNLKITELISYVPQDIFLFNKSIKSNITLSDDDQNIRIDEELIKVLNNTELEDFVRTLTEGIETLISDNTMNLSGGQKQRIGIARALYQNPEILILDEATSGLDYYTEMKILKNIKNIPNLTVIMITHNKKNAQIFDKLIDIENFK